MVITKIACSKEVFRPQKTRKKWTIYRFPHLRNVFTFFILVCLFTAAILHESGAFSPQRRVLLNVKCFGLDFVWSCRNDPQPKPRNSCETEWIIACACMMGDSPRLNFGQNWNKNRKIVITWRNIFREFFPRSLLGEKAEHLVWVFFSKWNVFFLWLRLDESFLLAFFLLAVLIRDSLKCRHCL